MLITNLVILLCLPLLRIGLLGCGAGLWIFVPRGFADIVGVGASIFLCLSLVHVNLLGSSLA